MQIMFYFQPRRGLFMPFIAMDDIILKCFNDGFSYLEIVELLNHVRDFQIISSGHILKFAIISTKNKKSLIP